METKAHITINSGSMGLKAKRQRNKVETVQQNSENPYPKMWPEYEWKTKIKQRKCEINTMKRLIQAENNKLHWGLWIKTNEK